MIVDFKSVHEHGLIIDQLGGRIVRIAGAKHVGHDHNITAARELDCPGLMVSGISGVSVIADHCGSRRISGRSIRLVKQNAHLLSVRSA